MSEQDEWNSDSSSTATSTKQGWDSESDSDVYDIAKMPT